MATPEAERGFEAHPRYALHERLGDGGGGVVYRARDHHQGRDVALKLLRVVPDRDPAELVGPLTKLAALDHPGVVRVHDFGQYRGQWFCVMELVEGAALLDHVRRGGSLDEVRLREALAQVAAGLRAMHVERLVHRDVKTENIRVTPEGRTVLLDLDLVKDLDTDQGAYEAEARPVGTALYMAPEQAALGRVAGFSDWYGFGVVLFECLTGRFPFEGPELSVLLRKQQGGAPQPRSLAPEVSPDLDALCTELLSVDPADRPGDVDVLHRLGVHEDVVDGRLSLVSLLGPEPPLVGRDAELAELLDEVEASRAAPRVVRVTGPAGVGKSALCRELRRRLAQGPSRPLLLQCACPRYPGQPHAPVQLSIRALVESLGAPEARRPLRISATALGFLERAFPGVVSGLVPHTEGKGAEVPDPLEQRWRAIEALRTVLGEVSRQRPLVWCIDDYQWADLDTQRLLMALLEGTDPPCLLMVLCSDTEAGVETGVGPVAHRELSLSALPAAATEKLAALLYQRAGAARPAGPPASGPSLPLLVRERVRHALFFEVPAPRSHDAEALLAERLEAVSPTARQLVRLLCCAFDPVSREVVERASGLSARDFSRQVSALRVAGLVHSISRGHQDLLAPAHPAVVDAVESSLPEDARQRLHAALSVAFVALGVSHEPGRLLRHQGEGGLHREAADSALTAAEQAHDGLAFQRAAELFSVCASLDPPGEDEAGHRLLRRMGDALAHAGWALQAATVYRQAAALARPDEALQMRHRAAAHLLRGDMFEEGLDALRELLASIGEELPRGAGGQGWGNRWRRAWLLLRGMHFRAVEEGQVPATELRRIDVMWATGLQLGLVDLLRGGDFMTRALLLALRVGEPVRVARALCTEAWMTAGDGSAPPERTASILAIARELVQSLDVPYLHGQLALAEGLVAFADLRIAECHERCRDAERVLRDHCADVLWEAHAAQIHQLVALALMARFDELRLKLVACRRQAHERGDVWGQRNLASLDAFRRVVTGGSDESAQDASSPPAPLSGAQDTSPFRFTDLFQLLAVGCAQLGRGEDASASLQRFRRRQLRSSATRSAFAEALLAELTARAALARARRRPEAATLAGAERAIRELSRHRSRPAAAWTALARAQLSALRGEDEAVAPKLRDAIELLEAERLLTWALPARYVWGRLSAGSAGRDARETARAQLQAAGVHDVELLSRMLLPGCSPPETR